MIFCQKNTELCFFRTKIETDALFAVTNVLNTGGLLFHKTGPEIPFS